MRLVLLMLVPLVAFAPNPPPSGCGSGNQAILRGLATQQLLVTLKSNYFELALERRFEWFLSQCPPQMRETLKRSLGWDMDRASTAGKLAAAASRNRS